MAGIFDNSSTQPRTIGTLLLAIGILFLLLGAPLLAYGVSLPSTVENEMLPFILLLCGILIAATGLAMAILGIKLRARGRRNPAA